MVIRNPRAVVDEARAEGKEVVVVMGVGFVGAVMAAIITGMDWLESGRRADALKCGLLIAALALVTVGATPRDESLDPPLLAAWTMVVHSLLNLDATRTRE